MQSKCWKIRERLGITENIFESILWYQKPKGMHWKTFNRLVQQEKKANNACREAIIKKIGLKVGCGEESEYCVVEWMVEFEIVYRKSEILRLTKNVSLVLKTTQDAISSGSRYL